MKNMSTHAVKINFHTASELPNFAIDDSFYMACGLDLNGPRQNKIAKDDLVERLRKAQEFVGNHLPQLFWHSVELQEGRNNGFQLFIDTNWTNFDDYSKRLEMVWNETGVVNSADGDSFNIQECPYFAKNCKKVTKETLARAIRREEQLLINLLNKTSKELELGVVQHNGTVLYS